jgi:hypothetical protein
MAKQSVKQIIQTIQRGNGSGGVFTPAQVKIRLDKELQVVADAIKEFMMAEIEIGRQHKIRRDQSGIYGKSVVTMTTDGGKIQLPDYAVSLDEGRKPGAALVPLESLIAWIKRYRILGRTQSNGRFKKASGDSINAAAYTIQQGIFRNGIIARPFINATMDFQQILIAQIVDEVMIPQIVNTLEIFFNQK